MFESTIGFSAALTAWDLKPEHAYNWEAAYIHDFSALLATDSAADIKLAYYSHITRDVIERDMKFKFDNIEKQTINRVELVARYSNPRFFTDLSVNYNLKNEVCDTNLSAPERPYLIVNYINPDAIRSLPACMKYEMPEGYLLTQAAPDFSAKWSLGGRFLQGRLELGGRVNYFNQYKNPDLDWWKSISYNVNNPFETWRPSYNFNLPLSWGETISVDAYANYRINKNIFAELTATNLTNQYYIDPASRSLMPAPGRTLKLSITASF